MKQQNFADRLKQLRKKKGLTIRDLSRQTKLSYDTLTSLEIGRSKIPNLMTVIILSRFFKVTIDKLIRDVDFS